MSLSLFARKAAVCWSIAGFCTSLLLAQPAFGPLGNEVPPAGVLPGQHSHPSLSVNAKGGFMVWEDNAIDEGGTGIRAIGLDTLLQADQAPFRVNFLGAENQEAPKVALLKDGGAVFVWRSGKPGLQKLYGRFLSASNTWLTTDVLISSPSNYVKLDPALAVLNNGNVLVAWGSLDQRGPSSMQDVYGQLLSPTGDKIGTTFPINQYYNFNQRSPSVAALPTGGFVVAWVSEQQRRLARSTTNAFIAPESQATVDIYARAFDNTGFGKGNEFLVNTNTLICANPSVAATPDGGYIISWSEGNPQSMTNQWDVVARGYSAAGVGATVKTVNTRIRGSQFAPSVAFLNNTVLIVWISVGQDGSGDGVYGQFFNSDLTPVGSEFRVNTTVRLNQNQAVATADGYGRFVAAWRTTQIRDQISVQVCSQMYALPGFQPLAPATNYAGPLFVGPTNTPPIVKVATTLPVPDFPVIESSGNIPADGFARAQGSYYGLLYNTEGVSPADSGFVTAICSDSGRYSVNIQIGTRTYALTGAFNGLGDATKQISKGAGVTPIQVTLHLDLSGSEQLSGTYVDGSSTCRFLANKRVYSIANRCPMAGTYNILLGAPTSETDAPQGSGYGSLVVYRDGKALVTAKLADGTVITQNTAVSRNGVLPLFSAPYSKKGLVLGWMQVGGGSVNGNTIWMKPATATKYYPTGFSGVSRMSGTTYTAPVAGQRVMDTVNGICEFTLSGAGLSGPVTISATMSSMNRVSAMAGSGLKTVINPQNGGFQGTWINPADNKPVTFNGRISQGQDQGAGFFLLNNKSGQVLLSSPIQ